MIDWWGKTDFRTWPWFGYSLSAVYIFFIFSLRCLPHRETCDQYICAIWGAIPKYLFAVSTDPVALFTSLLFFSTTLLWWVTRQMAKGAEDQTQRMQRSLDLAREEFEATHRPWISIEAEVDTQGISYADGEMTLDMIFKVKNVGASPALSVMVVGEAEFAVVGYDRVERQGIICDKHIGGENWSGRTIFPGELALLRMRWVAGKNWADRAIHTLDGKVRCLPTIMGAVVYQYPFGPRRVHFTRFIFEIWEQPLTSARKMVEVDGIGRPAGELSLTPWYEGQAFRAD